MRVVFQVQQSISSIIKINHDYYIKKILLDLEMLKKLLNIQLMVNVVIGCMLKKK